MREFKTLVGTVVAGIMVVASVRLATVGASAQDSDPGGAAASAQCGARYVMPNVAPAPGETPSEMKWAETPEASAAFQELDAVIKSDPALLDLRVNYLTRVITVVSEPGTSPRADSLNAIVDAVGSVDGATTSIANGCTTRAALDAAATSAREAMTRVLTEKDFQNEGGVGISADYAAGRVEIRSTPEAARSIIESMGKGSELAVHAGGPVAFSSRAVDPPPHRGGASYSIWDTGTYVGDCTTGFGANFTFVSMDVMATAAHCGVGGSLPMGGYNAGNLVGLFSVNGTFASCIYPGGPSTYGLDVAMGPAARTGDI